jgi:hypothetical protein
VGENKKFEFKSSLENPLLFPREGGQRDEFKDRQP